MYFHRTLSIVIKLFSHLTSIPKVRKNVYVIIDIIYRMTL